MNVSLFFLKKKRKHTTEHYETLGKEVDLGKFQAQEVGAYVSVIQS